MGALDLADYALVGINDLDSTDQDALVESFINSVVDERASSDIDEAGELQAIADAVLALRATVVDGVDAVSAITPSQLALFGISTVDSESIASIQTIIKRDAAT